MKKLYIAFASIIMMLAFTACNNNDEPNDLWMMNSQFINHVTDNTTGEFVNASLGGIYIEFNITQMTANVAYAFTVGTDEVVLEVTNAQMTNDVSRNGYNIHVAQAKAGSHNVSNLDIFIDMNLNDKVQCHWTSATVDGRYDLNGLLPVIAFKKANSHITKPDGTTMSENNGIYTFEIVGFSTENRSATLAISNVNCAPLDKGIKYSGLVVEPTSDGLHITTEGPVSPAEGSGLQYLLNELDATINFSTHSLDALIDIENVAKITTNSTF